MLCMWAVTYRIQEKLIVCSYMGKNVILNRACIYNNILWVVIMLEYCLLFGNIECGNEWFMYTSLNATDCQRKKVRIGDIFMSYFDIQRKMCYKYCYTYFIFLIKRKTIFQKSMNILCED